MKEEQKHIYDDHIDPELMNEDDSSIVEELEEELLEQEESETEKMHQELEALQKERDDYKQKYLYAMAEIENIRKRNARELPDVRWRAAADVLREIVNVVDDFELAVMNNQALVENGYEPDTETQSVIDGFELIYGKLIQTLDKLDCRQMDVRPQNDEYVDFDVDLYEAVSAFPTKNKKLNNKILDVQQNGYTYKERILRHAKVIVGKYEE